MGDEVQHAQEEYCKYAGGVGDEVQHAHGNRVRTTRLPRTTSRAAPSPDPTVMDGLRRNSQAVGQRSVGATSGSPAAIRVWAWREEEPARWICTRSQLLRAAAAKERAGGASVPSGRRTSRSQAMG